MVKNLVRRSYFQTLTVNTGIKTMMVEADEAYITQVLPSTASLKVQRQREKDLATFLTANSGLSGGASQTWLTVDTTYGRVNVLNPSTSDGKLQNRPVTTVANDLTQPERDSNVNIGVKEVLSFQSATAGQDATVIVEFVQYIPADEISS